MTFARFTPGLREERLLRIYFNGSSNVPAPQSENAPPQPEKIAETPPATSEAITDGSVAGARKNVAENKTATEMQRLYADKNYAAIKEGIGTVGSGALGAVEGFLKNTSIEAQKARQRQEIKPTENAVLGVVRDATESMGKTTAYLRKGIDDFTKKASTEKAQAEQKIKVVKDVITKNEKTVIQNAAAEATPSQATTALEATAENEGKNDEQLKDAKEKNETTADRYERVKGEQLFKREKAKIAEAGDMWSTIDNGKTDKEGNQFLYKKVDGANGPVLLAYAPEGGLQAMDTKTGQWRHIDVDQGSLEDQALAKANAGIRGEYGDLKNTGITSETQGKERQRQNSRNSEMEENCLKSKDAGPDWHKKNYNSFGGWKGNVDVRAALDAAIETPARGWPDVDNPVVPPISPAAPTVVPTPAPAANTAATLASAAKPAAAPKEIMTPDEERMETLLDTQKIITERIERAQLQIRSVEKDIREISSFNLLRSGERSAKEAELRQLEWKIDDLRHYNSMISTPGCPLSAIQMWREKLGLSRVPQSVADRNKNISYDAMEKQRKEAQKHKSKTVEVNYNEINQILRDADISLGYLENGLQILDQGMQLGTMFIPYGNVVYNSAKGATNVVTVQKSLGDALTETVFNIVLAKIGGKVVEQGGKALVNVGGKMIAKSDFLTRIAPITRDWVAAHTPDIAKKITGNSARGTAIGGVVGSGGTAIGNFDEWRAEEKTAAEIAQESYDAAKSGAKAGAVFGAVGGAANRKTQASANTSRPAEGKTKTENAEPSKGSKPEAKKTNTKSSQTEPGKKTNRSSQKGPNEPVQSRSTKNTGPTLEPIMPGREIPKAKKMTEAQALQILGLSPGERSMWKEHYKQLVLKNHPDRASEDQKVTAERNMQWLNAAKYALAA